MADALGAERAAAVSPLRVAFGRAIWDETTFTAWVNADSGLDFLTPARGASVVPSRVPVLAVRWGGAYPGVLGWCRVEPLEPFTLTGRVVLADGGPTSEPHRLRGCYGQAIETAPDGVFEQEIYLGGRCTLYAGSNRVEIDTMAPPEGELIVPFEDGEPDHRGTLIAESARYEAGQDGMKAALEVALDDERLSAESRQILLEWASEYQATPSVQELLERTQRLEVDIESAQSTPP